MTDHYLLTVIIVAYGDNQFQFKVTKPQYEYFLASYTKAIEGSKGKTLLELEHSKGVAHIRANDLKCIDLTTEQTVLAKIWEQENV